MNKSSTDRLQYADCAYMEDKLRAEADLAAAAAKAGDSPLLGPEELYALYLRFWAAERGTFDHAGFSRAIAKLPTMSRSGERING
ncbi:MAG: hypothetical protein ABI837_12885 [Acidobacteriota bacterium]